MRTASSALSVVCIVSGLAVINIALHNTHEYSQSLMTTKSLAIIANDFNGQEPVSLQIFNQKDDRQILYLHVGKTGGYTLNAALWSYGRTVSG